MARISTTNKKASIVSVVEPEAIEPTEAELKAIELDNAPKADYLAPEPVENLIPLKESAGLAPTNPEQKVPQGATSNSGNLRPRYDAETTPIEDWAKPHAELQKFAECCKVAIHLNLQSRFIVAIGTWANNGRKSTLSTSQDSGTKGNKVAPFVNIDTGENVAIITLNPKHITQDIKWTCDEVLSRMVELHLTEDLGMKVATTKGNYNELWKNNRVRYGLEGYPEPDANYGYAETFIQQGVWAYIVENNAAPAQDTFKLLGNLIEKIKTTARTQSQVKWQCPSCEFVLRAMPTVKDKEDTEVPAHIFCGNSVNHTAQGELVEMLDMSDTAVATRGYMLVDGDMGTIDNDDDASDD